MKSRILGLGLVFVLGLSMLLPAAPVSGRTLEWSKDLIMEESSATSPKIVQTGGELLDIAGSSGTVAWAVTTFSDGMNKGIRSTNSGRTWTFKTKQSDGTTNIEPVIGTNDLSRVTIATDDPNVVIVYGQKTVWMSTSNGDDGTWTKIGDTAAGGNLNTVFTALGIINSVAVSVPDSDGYRWIAIGGRNAAAAAAGTGRVVVGRSGAFGGFTDYSALASWTASFDVLAVAFSPRFRFDKALVAVTRNTAGTGAAMQLAETTTPTWNPGATFPTTNIAAAIAANRARIALPDTYYRLDEVERVAYIALDDSVGLAGGVFRMNNTTPKELFTGRYSSVALNSTLNQLLFGSTTNSRVELSTNANSSSPSSVYASTLNRAGGASVAGVAWAGATPLAATGGAEGGVHKGTADGLAWVGYGAIDTDLASITDVAVSADGKTIYIASINGNNVSIWKSTSGAKLDVWDRVLAELQTDATAPDAPIIRLAPGKPEAVFVGYLGSKQVRYTADGGKTWKRSETDWNIKDMAAKSDQIVFSVEAGSSGFVSTSKDGGFTFAKGIASSVSADQIVVEPVTGHVIVVGGSSGSVRLSVSKDDGATFTRTPETLGITDDTSITFVAPAPDYDKTNMVYAAQGQNISRWQVGGTMEDWYEINTAANSINYPITGATEVITGIGFSGNSLYAIWNDPGVNGGFARTTDFSARQPTWADQPIGLVVTLGATPNSLRFSTEGDSTRIWALNTGSATLDELWSYGDILGVGVAVELTGPEDKYAAGVTTALGVVQINPVRFAWKEVHQLAQYQLRLGTDKDVTTNYLTFNAGAAAPFDNEFLTISSGAGGAGVFQYPFIIGEAYYWKVRVSAPVVGPWSKIRSFAIPKPEIITPLKLSTPDNGAKDVSRNPAFSWDPLVGTKEYKVVVAGNSLLANPIAEALVTVPAYRIVTDLDYNKTYFWQVTPTKPTAGEPSPVFNFTTEKAPPKPTPPPPPPKKEYVCPYDGATFDNPQALAAHCSKWAPQPPPPPAPPVTPSWVWVVVGIGAALVIATLVLIVTTRRPPAP